MTNFPEQLKRTVIEMLMYAGDGDLAGILVDSEFVEDRDNFDNTSILVSIPAEFYALVVNETGQAQKRLTEVIAQATYGHVFDVDGRPCGAAVMFRAKLAPLDDNWIEAVRAQIAQARTSNQGLVTEVAFRRDGKAPVMYGELRFGSKTEVRIAQEFESRRVMFFPLAVAVKAETGQPYRDHREVDFLVVKDGIVGILEVAGPAHNGRQVADLEKDEWFQSAGIVCLKAYPAEMCWSRPSEVVDSFLKYMALHLRRP